MTELTPEERRRIYEEERQQMKSTRASWLKFLVLILMVGGVVYGLYRLITIRRQVAAQDAQIAQQASENAQRINEMSKSPGLDIAGQLNRIRSEGSDAESVQRNIKEADSTITYEMLKKNSDRYAGKAWTCSGTLLQIFERNGRTEALVSLDGWGNKNVRVEGDFSTDFVDKNKVYAVGYLAGDYSYKSVAGWNLTIPALAARAMLKPADAARMRPKR